MTCKSRRRNTAPTTSQPIASSCRRGLLIRLCCGLPTISLNNNSRSVSVGIIEVDFSNCKIELMCRRLQVPDWHIHAKPCCYSSLTVTKKYKVKSKHMSNDRCTRARIGLERGLGRWLVRDLVFPLGGCVRRYFACEHSFGEGNIQAAATRHV